jgi:trimeric autotransporter adhesin
MNQTSRVYALSAVAAAALASFSVPASSDGFSSNVVSAGQVRVASSASVVGGSYIANSRDFGPNVRVQLAPQSAYEEVGLPYHPALASARLVTQPLPDGGAQLVVRLRAPAAGPIDALAQVDSSTGQRFVQFRLSDTAPGSASAGVRAARASASVPEDALSDGEGAPVRRERAVERARQARTSGSGAAVSGSADEGPAPAAATASPAADSSDDGSAAPKAASGPTLGSVVAQSGDTLSKISARLARHGDVGALSRALFARNPSAFGSDSPDSLLAQARLLVPASAKGLLSDDGFAALGVGGSAGASASAASATDSAAAAGAAGASGASEASLRRQLDQKRKALDALKAQESKLSAQESGLQQQIDDLEKRLAAVSASSPAPASAASSASAPSASSAPSAAAPASGASAAMGSLAALAAPLAASGPLALPLSGAGAAMAPAASAAKASGAKIASSAKDATASAANAASSGAAAAATGASSALSALAQPAQGASGAHSASNAPVLPPPVAASVASASDAAASSAVVSGAQTSAASAASGVGAALASSGASAADASMASGASAPAAASGANAVSPAAKPRLPVPAPRPVAAPVEQGGFLGSLGVKAGLAAALALLLGLVGYQTSRRRRAASAKTGAIAREEPSADSAETSDSEAPPTLPGEEAAEDLRNFLGAGHDHGHDTHGVPIGDEHGHAAAPDSREGWESLFDNIETHLKLGDEDGARSMLATAEASDDEHVRERAAAVRARMERDD